MKAGETFFLFAVSAIVFFILMVLCLGPETFLTYWRQ